MNNKTRLDTRTRFELITNRLTFLDAEIAKFENERSFLQRELELLNRLHHLYKENTEDAIDSFRSEALTPQVHKTPVKGLEKEILSLLETGPASIAEIAAMLPHRSRKVISNTLSRLRLREVVVSPRRGVYVISGITKEL